MLSISSELVKCAPAELKAQTVRKLQATYNHTGKMVEMGSLSSSPVLNPLCQKRAENPALICSKCFSLAMQKRFGKDSGLAKKLENNSELLSGSILSDEQFPDINGGIKTWKYFRLEAFGDLINAIHAINYFRFCELNPETRFTLWTKNPHFIASAIKKGYSKPENLTIIYSSPCLNHCANDSIFKIFPFIDKVFTVYDKKTAKANGVEINCGARKCATCLNCYKANGIKFINELLK